MFKKGANAETNTRKYLFYGLGVIASIHTFLATKVWYIASTQMAHRLTLLVDENVLVTKRTWFLPWKERTSRFFIKDILIPPRSAGDKLPEIDFEKNAFVNMYVRGSSELSGNVYMFPRSLTDWKDKELFQHIIHGTYNKPTSH